MSAKVQVTKIFEFDAGHRLPDHPSKCANLHGHRYRLEVSLKGSVLQEDGHAQNGMVLDFADIKSIVNAEVVQPWDHAFLVYAKDEPVREFLASLPGHKTVVLDVVPTAENMVAIAYQKLEKKLTSIYQGRVRLERVRLYETPTSWAEVVAETSTP